MTFSVLPRQLLVSLLQIQFRRSLVGESQTVAPSLVTNYSVKESLVLGAMDFFYPWDWTRDWINSQMQWQQEDDIYKPPVMAKDQKDIPEWLRNHHQWEQAVDVNKLTKRQLKVKMCCSKCAEIVVEEIREVRGVFDVRAEQWESKVVVVAMPSGLDEHEVLMKARKVHSKAKFVDLDAKEKPKQAAKNKDGDGDKSEPQGDSKGTSKKQNQANPSQPISNVGQVVNWATPVSWTVPRYMYPPSHIQLYPNPNFPLVHFV